MGCQYSVEPCTLELKQIVKTCIEDENCKKLESSLQKLCQNHCIGIDAPIYFEKNISMNALGYALFRGKLSVFKFLKDKMHASPVHMESNLFGQQTSGVDILIERSNIRFLDYYLPIYLEQDKEILLESLHTMPKYCKVKGKSAIFRACENSNIQVMEYFKKYFESITPPYEFSINYVNYYTGDNCTFIACRNADLAMIKYLYENTDINFFQVNRKGHSCLNAAVLECGLTDHLPYQVCISFLVHSVHMDPHFNTKAYLNQAVNSELLDFLAQFPKNKQKTIPTAF